MQPTNGNQFLIYRLSIEKKKDIVPGKICDCLFKSLVDLVEQVTAQNQFNNMKYSRSKILWMQLNFSLNLYEDDILSSVLVQ